MEEKEVERRKLLDRWRKIQEDLEDDDLSPLKFQRTCRAKEQWFSDSFQFLIDLPTDDHIWCGFSDIMGPLLETFHSYFNDKRNDSPLKLLWKRVSGEMGQCAQCICQHHQAQESYSTEYESDSIDPLLKVLRELDEERVTEHLKEMNARLRRQEYDPECHSGEVVSVMFEVLMYPTMLDDQLLVNEFQFFIEEIEKSHDVNLAGSQQYPGVYALLFFKSGKARAIGLRLAGNMGKLRSGKDVKPLQPLLKKYIGFLETEISPPNTDTSRPRVQLEKTTIWLGIKTLLGFLEASAFEDGILEKYPNFLSSILNLVSDDTLESSYAITCLKACFEMLGCKLWWRTTLSPSVMRNTLLGQCFHTRNEKSHKDIFDLFVPFLQSLEALQDGELEKQRRHFIYFLLHQVTQSSNFSSLTRKNARKIALLLVHRGYKMNPPCPPFECGHMWGPSLVNSLKDSSLHSSLRQPAFDLIETIVVSDVSAMISLTMKCRSLSNIGPSMSGLNIHDDELFSFHGIEDDKSCWSEFTVQSKLASHECNEWTSLPMLWFDILVGMSPSVLPVSFSKAVFWALSHISMVLPNIGSDLSLSINDWLSLHAGEISMSFGWEVPNGSDDGGDGKESRNSVKVSSMCNILTQTFKRFAAGFITDIEKRELHRQWTWEPRMAESLIILLIDPDDAIRQSNKVVLEHVSKARDLTPQLKFLCSSASSLSSVFSGLRYALKQVQSDYDLSNFQNLHHLFFVVNKLISDVVKSSPPAVVINETDSSPFSSKGGFLRQPCFESSPTTLQSSEITVDLVTWEKFSYLLSSIMWPFILKCLKEGNKFIERKTHQMTFVRLLDTIPFIYERISLSASKSTQLPVVSDMFDFKWLSDLADLGKSSLPIITRRWKLCMLALTNLFKTSCSGTIPRTINVIESTISQSTGALDNLKNEILDLIKSISVEVSCTNKGITKMDLSFFEPFYVKEDVLSEDVKKMHEVVDKDVIVLSDDEQPNASTPKLVHLSNKLDNVKSVISDKQILPSGKSLVLDKPTESINSNFLHDQLKPIPPIVLDNDSSSSSEDESNVVNNKFPTKIKSVVGGNTKACQKQNNDLKPFPSGIFDDDSSSSEEENCHLGSNRLPKSSVSKSSTSLVRSGVADREKRTIKSFTGSDMARSLNDANSKFSSVEHHSIIRNFSSKTSKNTSTLQKSDALLMELVSDCADDPLEHALNNAKRPQFTLPKAIVTVPKRKVIQLNMPTNNKYGDRMNTGMRRLKPPKLDDWYRPIFELDYFSVVGLSSAKDEKPTSSANLKEVPLSFKSAEQYVEIFRPLVLEEFKAQLLNSFLETSPDDICSGSICILSVERIDDFHIVRGRPDNSENLFKGCVENDLILLTREPLKNSVQDVHILGKVERRDKNNKNQSAILVMRFYLLNGSSRLNNVKRFLTERSKWIITKIMSLTPQIREFQALSSLHEIPMLPIILDPTIRLLGSKDCKNVELSRLAEPLRNILKSSFNASQLEAISLAIRASGRGSNFELNLVQGPPGTGKTRTIVATVSALLSLNSVRESTNIPRTNPRTHISNSAAIARAWQDAALAKQIMKETEKTSEQPERSTKGRVLICAQSNAAVDELVSRINEGLYGNDGKLYKPYLVRVGNAKTVHPNSQPFFIDRLVEQRLAEDKSTDVESNNEEKLESSTSLRSKLEKLVDNIRYYESRRAKLDGVSENVTSNDDNGEKISDAMLGAKLNMLYSQKRALCAEISIAQSREKKASEESWALKNKIRKSILMEAEIVVTTLSGCGGDLYAVCSESSSSNKFGRFSEQCLFDIVVIDEAAQALEPATLIPLQLLKSNGTKCIMVGDPKQLPATVLSNVASKFLYECSMFERLQRAGHPVVMLTEQYRMHPEICRFPSSHFYDNKLSNGAQMASKVASFHKNSCLGPYMFFDIVDGVEHRGKSSASLSIYNDSEVEAAILILKFLKNRYPSEFAPGRIGIITPYRSQLSLLRSRFSRAFGTDIASDMEFNTVDGFQGREVDILILSTVRASGVTDSTSIGFVADVRRMNVALTRAKFSLWVIGNARTLGKNLHWAALIENAKERNLLVPVSKPYDSIFGNTLPPPSGNPSMKSKSDSSKTSSEVFRRRNSHKYPKEALNSHNDVPFGEVAAKCSNDKDLTMKIYPSPSIDGEGKKLQKQSHPSTHGNVLQENHKSIVRLSDKQVHNTQVETDPSVKRPTGKTKMIGITREHTVSCKPDRNQRVNEKTFKKKAERGNIHNGNDRPTKSKHLIDCRSPNVQNSAGSLKSGRDSGRSSNPATSSGLNQKTLPSDDDTVNKLSRISGSRLDVGNSPESLMAKRKRQREDVEALMSSAFIPSKKYESSSRPGSGKYN